MSSLLLTPLHTSASIALSALFLLFLLLFS